MAHGCTHALLRTRLRLAPSGRRRNGSLTRKSLRVVAAELDAQFAQLLRIYWRGRLSHQFLTTVVFRKRHHVPNGLLPADQHDEPIKPQRDAAVRRRT